MLRKLSIRLWSAGLVVPALALVACEEAIESPQGPGDVPAQMSHGDDPSAPVLSFDGFVAVGTSHIVRTLVGVNYQVSTTDLEPGHAYTLWFVVFNDPSGCLEPSPLPTFCGASDVVNDAARPDMMYAAGLVVGASGQATFAGSRRVSDSSGSINAPVGLPAYGLENPLGAEMHLVVHDHGPAMAQFMPDMITTVDGGCTDAGIPEPGADSPWNNHAFGRRGPNTCQSVQFAAHSPQ